MEINQVIDATEMMKEISALQQQLDAMRATLKRQMITDSPPTGKLELFICRVGGERVGMLLDYVEEVLPMCEVASLPEAPAWMPGLMNLRGSAIPLIDASARIEKSRREADINDLIVICSVDDRKFGVVVQQVHQIAVVDAGEMQTVPDKLPLAPYVQGLFQINGSTVFLFSLSFLLSSSEIPETK